MLSLSFLYRASFQCSSVLLRIVLLSYIQIVI